METMSPAAVLVFGKRNNMTGKALVVNPIRWSGKSKNSQTFGSGSLTFPLFSFSFSDMSPFHEQSETSMTVQAGEAAVLEVQAVESQPKPAVTWEAEDGSPLYGHKYAVGPDNQLVILSVSEADAKLYRYGNWHTLGVFSVNFWGVRTSYLVGRKKVRQQIRAR